MLADLVELDERERGQDVREVRLEARDADVVQRARVAAHEPQLVDLGSEVVVVGA